MQRVFGLRDRVVGRTIIAVVLTALFVAISAVVVSSLGWQVLLPFWLVLGIVIAVCFVCCRLGIHTF